MSFILNFISFYLIYFFKWPHVANDCHAGQHRAGGKEVKLPRQCLLQIIPLDSGNKDQTSSPKSTSSPKLLNLEAEKGEDHCFTKKLR